MDLNLKEKFTVLWGKYFNNSPLPVTFYYTDEEEEKPVKGQRCVIGDIYNVIKDGRKIFNADVIGCPGGKRYLGFPTDIMPNFEYFLSCGIPGKMEGERYKKTPELVKKLMKNQPQLKAPGKYMIFSRWDKLTEKDNPQVAIFFAKPDVLSGLFTLVNFDEEESNGVIAPFGAGCMTSVMAPYMENSKEHPKAVMGLFDVSARPGVPENILSISIPFKKLEKMIENMEESFLITKSWKKVKDRIGQE